MRYRGIFVAGLLGVGITSAIVTGNQLYIIMCAVGAVCGVYLFAKTSNGVAIAIACLITVLTATQYRQNIDNMYKTIDTTQKVRATAILLNDTWYLVDEKSRVLRAINTDEFVNNRTFEFNFKPTAIMENDVEFLLNSGATILGAATDVSLSDEPIQLPIMAKIATEVDSLIKKLVINTRSSYKGVTLAMMFSERAYTNESVLTLFRRTGIYHLTSVSGVHISILLAVIATFIPILKRYAVLRLIVFILFGGVIFVFSGYSASALRAISIACIHCVAQLCSSDSDGLNTVGLSLLVAVWLAPWAVLSVGFYMSYGIYLGIVIFGERLSAGLSEILGKLLRKRNLPSTLSNFCAVVGVSLICSVSSAVLSVLIFGNISPFSGLVSMLTIPFMTPLLICGYIGTVAMYFDLVTISRLFMAVANAMSAIIHRIASLFDGIAGIYTDIYSGVGIASAIVMIALLALACAVIILCRRWWRVSLVLSSVLLSAYIFTAVAIKHPSTRLILPHDTATLILNHNNRLVVINGSSDNEEYRAARLIKNLENSTIDGVYDIRYLRSFYERARQLRVLGVDQAAVYVPQLKSGTLHKFAGLTFSEQYKNYSRATLGDRKLLILYGAYGNEVDKLADRLLFEPYDVIFTQNGSLMLSQNTRCIKLPQATVIEFL